MGKTRTPPVQITQKTSRLDDKEAYAFSISALDNEATINYGITAAGLIKVGGLKKLANKTINQAETSIAHGLGYIPTIILITPTSNATFYMSKAADATNVYFRASADGSTADIYVA